MPYPEVIRSTLTNYRNQNVFNPYSDICPVFDKENANIIRQQNLIAILSQAMELGVHSVWIGRDLGYRGGRRTGIALTDDVHLPQAARRFGLRHLEVATAGPCLQERTAKVIWRELDTISENIMFWNVFPFHPHPPGDAFANRAHTPAEQASCKIFLTGLIDMLRPSCLVAIGRDAESATSSLGLPIVPVRHPSYGGQSQFSAGIRSLYGGSQELTLKQLPLFS